MCLFYFVCVVFTKHGDKNANCIGVLGMSVLGGTVGRGSAGRGKDLLEADMLAEEKVCWKGKCWQRERFVRGKCWQGSESICGKCWKVRGCVRRGNVGSGRWIWLAEETLSEIRLQEEGAARDR